MHFSKEDKSTHTQNISWKSPEERYKSCGFLNTIQHIDIYYKNKGGYNGRTNIYGCPPASVTCVSKSSSRSHEDKMAVSNTSISINTVESKLSKLSVTTKVTGLYPGHDISRRARKLNYAGRQTRNFAFGSFVPR